MVIVNFFINQVLREPALFLGLIAMFGLILQKKGFSDIISGTLKTLVGVVILTIGTSILVDSLTPLSNAFYVINNIEAHNIITPIGSETIISEYGIHIGLAMLFAFLINIIVARLTPLKNVFLTGHMLFWFPFIFVSVAIESNIQGVGITIFATVFTALYIIIAPALIKPFVKQVTGNDSFTLGHPTIGLSILAGYIGKWFGNKEKSTEDIKFPVQIEFLREITITSSLVVFIVYIVLSLFVGYSDAPGIFETTNSIVMYSIMQGALFGAGLTVLLQGVRMMLAEIIPAFKGISDSIIPNAVPALDCPIIFPFAPNAVLIGFIVSMITSTIVLLIIGGMGIFPYVILPLTITCFFEIGTSAVIANGTGGLKGAILGSAVAGVVMILLVAFSIPFLQNTSSDWIIIFGGNDFSLWAIISGMFARLFGS